VTEHKPMTQQAPYPHELADLVERLEYKSSWRFSLQHRDRGQGSIGLTLTIQITGPDSYDPLQVIRVNHFFTVPPAAYQRHAWRRWLLEQILLVERHEACEFFTVDGEKPFAPHHGPGEDPYTIFEHGTSEQVRTSFRGELNPV
jgi:hypothetical protein